MAEHQAASPPALTSQTQSNNMPKLHDLSTELLLQVFIASPSVKTAIQPSGANKRLRDIWLQHTTFIVDGIINSTIPAADDAVALALLEVRLRNPGFCIGAADELRPPLWLWIPVLERNAELCASAHDACSVYVWYSSPERTPDYYTSSPEAYYVLCRVMLAWEFPHLRKGIHKELQAASDARLHACKRLYWYLGSYASKQEAARHGFPYALWLDDEDSDPDDPTYGDPRNKWEYMGGVIHFASVQHLPYAAQFLAGAIDGHGP